MAALMTRQVPASAAAGISPLIAGPPLEGVVLGALTDAVIIGVTTEAGPRVVSLLGARASGVPNGVRLPAGQSLDGHRAGDPVRVGGGGIRIGALSVTVVRIWPSAVRLINPTAGLAGLADAAGASDRGLPSAAIEPLRRAVDGGSPLGPAVDRLVGLGVGLTPGGDDVIAGLLTGLHAAGRPELARPVADLDRLDERTTMLSADLIRLAAAGHACREVLALLSALHAGAPLAAPVHRLLSIGHTSGADLATGLAIGLRACRQGVR